MRQVLQYERVTCIQLCHFASQGTMLQINERIDFVRHRAFPGPFCQSVAHSRAIEQFIEHLVNVRISYQYHIEWASAQVPPTPLYLGGTVGRERETEREREREREG